MSETGDAERRRSKRSPSVTAADGAPRVVAGAREERRGPALRRAVLHAEKLASRGEKLEKNVVGGLQLVAEVAFQRVGSEPSLAGGHVVDHELRPLGLDEGFEQGQHVLDVSLGLLHVGFLNLLRRSERALEFARGDSLKLHPLLLEPLVHVGNLGDDADGPEHGERGGDEPVRGARHHVPAGRRHLLDADRELDPGILESGELRGGEAVARHRTSARVQYQHHLVATCLLRRPEHGGDLFAQVTRLRRANVAEELENKDVRLVPPVHASRRHREGIAVSLPPGAHARIGEEFQQPLALVRRERPGHRGDVLGLGVGALLGELGELAADAAAQLGKLLEHGVLLPVGRVRGR